LSRRGKRLTVFVGVLVFFLFAGRWTATLLADRWWAAQLSPAAAAFITDWHLLRFTLDLCGCLVASAWFIGHLLLVYRAVGTVQVRRNVANLEFREALTPRALLTMVTAGGVLLGLLVGVGASGWWRDVTLAWNGVSYGMADPLLGQDLGIFVAQLPVWRAAHGFFLLLVLLALTGVAALYMLVGAIRWIERRPAINHHARAHLGWLFAALAVTLAWGYLLERYELLVGPAAGLDQATWRSSALTSPVLAGIALGAGILSGVWASRPRHALAISGWIIVAFASIAAHWLLPSALGGSRDPVADTRSVQQLTEVAYGLEGLRDQTLDPVGPLAPPSVPSLWNPAALAQVLPGDSARLLSVDPALLTPEAKRRPAWLIVRSSGTGRVSATAVADHQVSPTGEPLFYRLGDSLPRAAPTALLELQPDLLAPDAPAYRISHADNRGVSTRSWLRRIALAWALQAGELLAETPPGTHVDWHLAPEERVARLAPFADWSAPTPRIIDGQLVWLLDGYIASNTFPLTSWVSWRNREVKSLRASLLATVNAETGATHVYLQANADPVTLTWSRVAEGVVEPASAIPETVLREASYPVELFRTQAQQLERAPWSAGSLSRRPVAGNAMAPVPQISWAADTSGPLTVSTYESSADRRFTAMLLGSRENGQLRLVLVRLDSTLTLPVASTLEDRWSNFPSYDALNDSIREDGGRLDRGPLRVELSPGGPVAYQTYFALRPSGGTVLAWVSVAAPNRLGAGRTLKEAWGNLLGATVPAPPGPAQTGRLDEARRWMEHADSALRGGDWSEFGRAWSSLRNVLGVTPDTTKF
jgi:hypothetical protein